MDKGSKSRAPLHYSLKNKGIADHDCGLPDEEDLVNFYISSGSCVPFRRWFRSLCLASPNDPQSKALLRSSKRVFSEKQRHLKYFYYMIHPFSDMRYFWNCMMVTIYSTNSTVSPLLHSSVWSSSILVYLNMYCLLFFYVDIGMSFVTGFYDAENSRVVLRRRSVVKKYLKTFFFIDVISSLPMHSVVYFMEAYSVSDHVVIYCLRLLDGVKICRIPTMMRYLHHINDLAAQIFQFINRSNSSKDKKSRLLQNFSQYIKYKELPDRTRDEIFHFVEFKFKDGFLSESNLENVFSRVLIEEIMMHSGRKLVEEVDFFKDLPDVLLLRLVTKLKPEFFLANEVMVEARTTGSSMCFIYRGSVAIYTVDGKELCHLQDGNHFGEITLLLSEPRVTSVVVVKDCQVLRLTRKDYLEAIGPFPEWGNMIRKMAIEKLEATMARMQLEGEHPGLASI